MQVLLAQLLAGAQGAQAWGTEIVGGAYDKIAGKAAGKLFPGADQEALKKAIVDKIVSGKQGTTLDDLMGLFPAPPDTTPGQVRGRMR